MELAQLASTSPSSEVEPCLHAIMDCSYVASATARLLSRLDRHEPPTTAAMVEVCARVTVGCAERCANQHASTALARCGEVARDCAQACAAMLAVVGVDREFPESTYRRMPA